MGQVSLDLVSLQIQLGLRAIAQLTDQLREEFQEDEIVRLHNHLAYEQGSLLTTAKGDSACTRVVH